MRVLLLAVVLTLAFSQGAGAVTLVWPDGTTAQPYQRWADALKVPTPTGTFTVHEAECPSPQLPPRSSCAMPDDIWLVTEGRPTYDRRVFKHELGHEFDAEALTDEDRAALQFVLHVGGAWRDLNTPHDDRAAERFANAYGTCADGIPRWIGARVRWSALSWRPTTLELRAVCAVIRHAGGWYMQRATSAR